MPNRNDNNRPQRSRIEHPFSRLQHDVPVPKQCRGRMRSQSDELESMTTDFDDASLESELRMASSLLCEVDDFVDQVMTRTAIASPEERQLLAEPVRMAVESEKAEDIAALPQKHEYASNAENWAVAAGIAVLVAALTFVLARMAMPSLPDESELASSTSQQSQSEEAMNQPVSPLEQRPAAPTGDSARSLDDQGSLAKSDPSTRMPAKGSEDGTAALPILEIDAHAALARLRQFFATMTPRKETTSPSIEPAREPVKFNPAWQLAVHFGGDEVAEVRINGGVVGKVPRERINEVLPLICSEVTSRLEFLQPAFRGPLQGVVTVNQKSFVFHEVAQANTAFENAATYLASLDKHSPIRFFKSRYNFPARLDMQRFGNVAQHGSVALLDRSSPLVNGVPKDNLVFDAVLRTERVFRQLLADGELANSVDESAAFAAQGTPDSYLQRVQQFVDNGALVLPFGNGARTQILSEPDLRAQLKQTAMQLDVFRSGSEFRKAEKFVVKLSQSTSGNYGRAMKSVSELIADLGAMEGAFSKSEFRREYEIDRRMKEMDSKYVDLSKPEEPLREYLDSRDDLAGLPLVMGKECRSDFKQSLSLSTVSDKLGNTLSRFDAFGSRAIAAATRGGQGGQGGAGGGTTGAIGELVKMREQQVHAAIASCNNLPDKDQALRTLEQMLQVDSSTIRINLVNDLKNHGTAEAVRMLVDRAKYDFDSQVRVAAVNALKELKQTNSESVRTQLMDGFDYPWHVVAEHSAEALVALDDKQVLPRLLEQLRKSDPRLPFQRGDELIQRQLVAVNHLKNCLLCHAPANRADRLGVARVPSWGKRLSHQYYKSHSDNSGGFVRADVTYMKQDFSVMQEVEDAAPWPTNQRFDYVVQERTINAEEAEAANAELSEMPNRNRESVIFALQQLTGKKAPVNDYNNWLKIVANTLATED